MTTVLYDKRDRIAYVTINRPQARNAIDLETHEALCETWADFRDDDAVDVAILTGAGDEAFCAGADLKTYIPPIIRGEPRSIRDDRRPRPRRPDARPAPHPQAGDRGGQRLGAGGRARDWRWPATSASPPSARASAPSRRAAATTTATAASCGWSTRAASGVASHMLLTAEPIDAAAGAAVEPGHEGRRPRRADGRGRAGRPPDPAQLPARGAQRQGDDPRRRSARTSTTSCAPRRGTRTPLPIPRRRWPCCSASTTARTRAAHERRPRPLPAWRCGGRGRRARHRRLPRCATSPPSSAPRPTWSTRRRCASARASTATRSPRAGPTRWPSSPPRRSPARRCCA